MEKGQKESSIKKGDKVELNQKFYIGEYTRYSLMISLQKDMQTIKISRLISGLGERHPKFSWAVPNSPAIPENDFDLTGRYRIGDELYQAELLTIEEIDDNFDEFISNLSGLEDSGLPGSLVCGYVIAIRAEYNTNPKVHARDFQFFDTVDEAIHDFYADQVFVLIQDEGTLVEYFISYKFLKKC